MYLYSNIIGTFVFNQNIKIREKIIFSKKDLEKNFKLLIENKILDSEKKILEKFKNIKNLRQENDENVLLKVYMELAEFEKQFYENNIYITKLQIKESITPDLLIIQAIGSINEIKKSINLLSKRLREWYSYVLPEVENSLDDHISFAERISKDSTEKLSKDFNLNITMGKDLGKEDLDSIKSLASAILDLDKQKQKKEIYLEKLMKKTCPNLEAVAGYLTGAKLLAIAGSLRNMVMMPASTIQLLGAEKALFMHMIRGTKSPKHGVIVEHPLIQKVDKKDKGKASRALADKISLAVKLDFFKGKFIGDKLRKELQERFK
jgi:nucleolar protein 56